MHTLSKFTILLFVLVVGCSQKQVINQPIKEHSATAKLVMNKHWLEGDVLVVQNPDTTSRDITTQFPAPERDDILILSDDGTYQYDEGASKLDPRHKKVFVQGTWEIDEPHKVLLLTANGSTNTYEILEVTDSTLVLKLPITQRNKSYFYTLYFKRIEGE